jgi:serine/threonine-protein kinase RsbW
VTILEAESMGDVSLNVPAKPDFLHVVRAVVSGVAARQGLLYDAIDDLCLAANEAAAYLLAVPDGGRRLCVRMRVADAIELTFMTDAPVQSWPPPMKQSLAWRILRSLVDDVGFVVEEGCPAIRLAMQAPLRRREP